MGLFDFLSRLFTRPEEAPIMSSTPEYRSPMDVFCFFISRLPNDPGHIANFKDRDDEMMWVQVISGRLMAEMDAGATLNFSYPCEEEPDDLIAKLGIALPPGYELGRWEKQLSAAFDGPKCSPSELAKVVDELFTKLLRVRRGYVVEGRF